MPKIALRRLLMIAAPLVVVVAFVVILVEGGEDDSSASQSARTAPLSPPRVPARPSDAVTDEPGEGTEAEEDRRIQLPLPDPDAIRPGSSRRALAEFMDAWHDRAWDRMATWTSRAWRDRQEDPSAELRRRYGPFVLRGWTVLDADRKDVVSTFTVLTAQRDLEPQIVRERLRIVTVNETADGSLVGTGPRRWTVLPE